MSGLKLEDWLLGEVLADPEKLFVLWAVKVGFCQRVGDFQKAYGTDFPIEKLVVVLERDGFLERTDDALALTETGASAASSLQDNKSSPSLGDRLQLGMSTMASQPPATKPEGHGSLNKFLTWLILTLVDPIVFVSIVGPLAIGWALALARGDFASYAPASPLLTLLTNVQLAGIVDYIISFYTALLGFALLTFQVGRQLLPGGKIFNQLASLSSDHAGAGKESWTFDQLPVPTLLFLLLFICYAFTGLWLFFLGGGAQRELLETYASQDQPLGHIHWPLDTRFLTIRVITALFGIWLARLDKPSICLLIWSKCALIWSRLFGSQRRHSSGQASHPNGEPTE